MRLGKDTISGTVFFGLAVVAVGTVAHLPLGNLRLPGPSALPVALGSALGLLSIVLVLGNLRGFSFSAAGQEPNADPGGHVRIAASAILIGIYAASLEVFGFLVATIALMTALFYIGAVRPTSIVPFIAALSVTMFSYVLFVLLLNVRLPSGTYWVW